MKKLIAFVVAAMMVLSMIPAMAFTASAAGVEGDWAVMRNPNDYDVDIAAGETYTPAPGYEYTDEGFTTIPADYSGMTPYFHIQTRDAQNIRDGVYLEFRVDDYSYGGAEGTKDHWISFNLSDRENITLGAAEYGNNWCTLMRGPGNGASTEIQSFITTMNTDDVPGVFAHQGSTYVEPPKDDQGREIYTLEITWDGTNYDIKVCGLAVAGNGAAITDKLNSFNENGDFYIGITFHTGEPNGTAGGTILKYGTSEAEATTPVGSDSAEPEENLLVFGEMVDSATVPAGQPALLWDATKATFTSDPTGTNCVLTAQGDNSYHIEASGGVPYYIWSIKNSLTYEAADFPVFAMLMKDFWGDTGGVYYCAGDILSADETVNLGWSIYDDGCMTYGEDDEYVLVVVDLTDLWSGRIHNIRPYFGVSDTTDDMLNQWDVNYMGFFRSIEEAQTYATTYLGAAGVDTGAGEETTEAPTPGDDTTDDTKVEESGDVADTGADTKTEGTAADPTETDDAASDNGCASVIGMGAIAILSAAMAAFVLKKRN